MIRIKNYTFDSKIVFCALNSGKGISIAVPYDIDPAILEELKNAGLVEELDSDNEVIASYRLTGWRKIETIGDYTNRSLLITWSTVNLDDLDSVRDEIDVLQSENEILKADNADLVAAIIELAGIVGETEEN